MASSYMLQAIVGLVVSLSMYFLADYFYAAGLILPMGFGQSIGSALSRSSNYETNYGFEGGASFGLPVASIGFIVVSVIDVIYLNIVCKKCSEKGKICGKNGITKARLLCLAFVHGYLS